MKTTLLKPKKEHLLGVSLKVLHAESKEWLESIAFWKDEIRFFNSLLKKFEANTEKKRDFAQMLQNMDQIHRDLFEFLEDEISDHEILLAKLEKGEKGLADADYRKLHEQLKSRMTVFNRDFRTFKKMVFGYAKELKWEK